MSSFSIQRGTVPYRSRLGWLPLSVALNLLLIGLVVAWELNLPAPPRQPLVTWQRELIPSLSPSDAAIVTEAAGQVADAQAAGDVAVHAQFDKVRAILAADPVDQAALAAAFNEMADIRQHQQMLIGKAFTEELDTVSAAGRQRIRAALIEQGQRWRPTPGR
jgi:heavy-metal resistance protein